MSEEEPHGRRDQQLAAVWLDTGYCRGALLYCAVVNTWWWKIHFGARGNLKRLLGHIIIVAEHYMGDNYSFHSQLFIAGLSEIT